MARKICDYCGTEYDDSQACCPLCGSTRGELIEEEPRVSQPVQRKAEPEELEDVEELLERHARRRAPEHRREADDRESSEGRRSAGRRKEDRRDQIPRGLSILICVILGIAVVIGALYALYKVGVFSLREAPDDTSLELPIDDESDTETDSDPTTSDTTDPAEPATVSCTGLTVSPATVRMNTAGISTVVTAVVEPADCTDAIVWSSSDTSICTVDSQGVITAVDGGTATVTAACGGFTAEVEVNCDFSNSQENNAYLSTTDFTLFSTGETAEIQVLDAPDGASITWSTSDASVCTVANGTVTAVGGGTATVTATVNDKALECTVRCSFTTVNRPSGDTAENTPSGSGNQLDHTDVTLSVGQSFEISVVNGVSGGWNVSDASVISVDANGIVTALSSGTATVYTVIGGERLECIVRVP